MPSLITPTTSWPSCSFGEIRHCRHYRESTLLKYDKRPKYCRVGKSNIEEEEFQ